MLWFGTMIFRKQSRLLCQAGSSIYILDNMPTAPWWKSYFQLDLELRQAGKGALVFLPAGNRYFALSFGHVYHNLKDQAYEHDFGLKVTLNCIDPNELKSTDTLEPGAARRLRTQLPVGSDLNRLSINSIIPALEH